MPRAAFAFGHSQSEHEIYAIGGATDDRPYNSNMQVYSAKLNLWLDIATEGLPGVKYGSAVYLEDYKGVLIAGGIQQYGSASALVDEIRIVYTEDHKTEILGRLPEPAKSLGIANDGNKVYLFGGSKTRRVHTSGKQYFTFSDQLFVYNLEDGHLAQLPEMPVPMETNGGIIDGKLYTFGGFAGSPLSSVWQYDIKEETWNELKSLDKPLSSYALTKYGQYFILVGDYNDGGQLIVYDTKSQSAKYFKTNINGRHMGASILGEYLHVYGGLATFPQVHAKNGHYKIAIRELIKFAEQ